MLQYKSTAKYSPLPAWQAAIIIIIHYSHYHYNYNHVVIGETSPCLAGGKEGGGDLQDSSTPNT